MKTLKFYFIFFNLGFLISQNPNFCMLIPDTISTNNYFSFTCFPPNSVAFHKKYKQASTYIPKPGSRTKIINLNFNIFQDASGSFNFPLSDPNSTTKINNILSWVKWFYISNSKPTDTINCLSVSNLNSKYIDFNINGIYFYQDNTMFNTACNIPVFINYIKAIDSMRLKAMNYFASYGIHPGASGCTNHLPALTNPVSYSGLNSGAVTYSMDINPWVSSQNMAHEIGHMLGLHHTYHGGGTSSVTICDLNNFDYLYDVHGPSSCSLCPHLGTWADPAASPNDGITNNLMGGSIDIGYASLKQIGMMHRSLYLLTPGKYTQCTYDPNNPFEVDTVELWGFINFIPKKGQVINGLLIQMNEKYLNLFV